MKETEQGVLLNNKIKHFSAFITLYVTFLLSFASSAETTTNNAFQIKKNIADNNGYHAYIIYPSDDTFKKDIATKISAHLKSEFIDIKITEISPEDKKLKNNADIIIAIGNKASQTSAANYPFTKKLFITSNSYDLKQKKDLSDAALYMAQPYCRQFLFIKNLNTRFKTISILNSQGKPLNRKLIQQCADKNNIKAYIITIDKNENMSTKIKHALNHSDALLALPDHNIFNRKTVKNILLTSYRYRKPVIAFSNNFVVAGALASIHSDAEQISQTAGNIIKQYFENNKNFTQSVNYPHDFSISINAQVFKALNLPTPDAKKLKGTLENKHHEKPSNPQ